MCQERACSPELQLVKRWGNSLEQMANQELRRAAGDSGGVCSDWSLSWRLQLSPWTLGHRRGLSLQCGACALAAFMPDPDGAVGIKERLTFMIKD